MRDSEFYPAAEKSLGDLLRVIEQGNLGGSGGYARGQLESVRKGTATYAMMMDDDVVCEPEGIIRAVTFGDLAKRPTIVGGHMFNIYKRSQLHSFGEIVQPWRFWWTHAPRRLQGVGLRRPQPALSALAAQAGRRRLQRLVHVPDPAPGPGGDRAVAAALHQVGRQRVRPARQGGGLPDRVVPGGCRLAHPVDRQERRRSTGSPTSTSATASSRRCSTRRTRTAAGWSASRCNHQIKHLVSMQYSTVEMRHRALEDVLAGPYALHAQLPDQAGRGERARASSSATCSSKPDRDDLPPVRRKKPPQARPRLQRDPGPALAADHRRARADPAAATGA